MRGGIPWGRADNFERSLIGKPITSIRALSMDQLAVAQRWLSKMGVDLPKKVRLTMENADKHRIVGELLTSALDIARAAVKRAKPREPKPDQTWLEAEREQMLELAVHALSWLVVGQTSLTFVDYPCEYGPQSEEVTIPFRPEDAKAIARSVVLSEKGTPGFGDSEAERCFENQQAADEAMGRNTGATASSSGYHPDAWVCETNIKPRTKRRARNPVENIRLNTRAFGIDDEGWWMPLRKLGLKAEPVSGGEKYNEHQPVDDLFLILTRTVQKALEFTPKRQGSVLVFRTNIPGWQGKILASTSNNWPFVLFRVPEPLFVYQWAHATKGFSGDTVIDAQALETWNIINTMPTEEINRLIGLSKKWVQPEGKWVNDDPDPAYWINPAPENLNIDLRSSRKVLLKGRRKYAMRLQSMRLLMQGHFGIDRWAVIGGERRSVLSFKVFGPVAEQLRVQLGFNAQTPKQMAKFKAVERV